MKLSKNNKNNKGISLIEVVVSASIIFIVFVGLISAYNLFLEMALKNTAKIQSAYMLEEGLEAIRSVRDNGWDDNILPLNEGVFYGLSFNTSNSSWEFNTTPSMTGVFYREFQIFDVLRDGNDDISSTGTLDPNTVQFQVNVSWLEGNATTTKSINAYLSKIF